MRGFPTRPVLALALALSLVAAACTGDGDTAGGPGDGEPADTVTVGAEQELTSFNINTTEGNVLWGVMITRLIWPSAYYVNPELELVPSLLAEPAEVVAEDPFTVRWTIHENAVWDDGTPVSSDDLEYRYLRCNGEIDPGEPVATDDDGNEVTGVDCASTDGYDRITEFRKVDEKTAEAVFDGVYVDYEGLFWDLPPAHLADERAEDGESAWGGGFDDDPGASAGPYRLEEWVQGESLTLVRNEDYWGEPAATERLVFRFITDAAQQPDALRNAEVDLIYPQPQVDLVEAVRGLSGVEHVVGFGPTWEQIIFNLDNPHLARPEVRRAIAMGTDRQAMVDALLRPFSEDASVLGNRVYVEGQSEYQDNTPTELRGRDVDGARALLEQAGYTLGDDDVYQRDGERLSLRISTTGGNPRRERLQELLIDQWAEIGIAAETYNLPGTDVFGQRIFAPEGDFDVALFAFVGDVFPATTVAQLFSTDGGSNVWGYSNERLDQLVAEALVTLDPERRAELLNQADEVLWEDLPNIPLFQLPTFGAWTEDLRNVEDNVTNWGITWNAHEWELRR